MVWCDDGSGGEIIDERLQEYLLSLDSGTTQMQ